VQTTAASHILEGFKPHTIDRLAKLWDAGAGMLGKLNLDQFAMGSSNERAILARGVPVAPQGRYGGSGAGWFFGRFFGGGGGAHRACGDGHRHGRFDPPACGLHRHFGHQADLWPLLALGHCGFASSLDQAGPMAHTVQDCAVMLEAMSGFDAKDATSLDLPVPDGTSCSRRI
jgi:aspartyl-tRNA(Asn)/glutamyl-tRNA(Gln) amidotransferase subunit A